MTREQPLFRPAAAAARRHDWRGGIVLTRPLSFAVASGAALAFAGSLALLGYLGSYTAHATLRGRLVPETGVVEVRSPEAGTIVERHAAEGQTVAPGDVLYVVSSERFTAAGTAAAEEVGAQLARRRASLVAQIASTAELERAERESLAARSAALRAERAGAEEALAAERQRLALATAGAARYARLHALGFVAEEQWAAREAAVLEQRGRVESLQRDRAGLARLAAELEGRAATLGLQYANAVAELERAVAGADRELIENDARRASAIAAPRAGVVTAPAGELGQPVDRGAVLARIVPRDSVLQAELFAPSRAVGFVAAGDVVRLRYAAFPYQKFGHAEGTVISVSQATLGATEAALPGGLRGEPSYRVAVALRAQTVTAYGEPRRLLPGMEVEADVQLETRRIYEWVLEPLYALGRQAR